MNDATALRADAFDPAMIDFEVFALFLEARRIHRRKTVARIANGQPVSAPKVIAVCDWLGLQVRDFYTPPAGVFHGNSTETAVAAGPENGRARP